MTAIWPIKDLKTEEIWRLSAEESLSIDSTRREILENMIAEEPSLLWERLSLCWYYHRNLYQPGLPETHWLEICRCKHLAWLARNCATSPFVAFPPFSAYYLPVEEDYLQIKQIWDQNVKENPEDAIVLMNLAYVTRDQSEKISSRLKALQMNLTNLELIEMSKFAEINEKSNNEAVKPY
jgi:hypothetical protein